MPKDFLKNVVDEMEKKIIIDSISTELNYRVNVALMMEKATEQRNAEGVAIKKLKDMHELKLRKIREIQKEVKEGKLTY